MVTYIRGYIIDLDKLQELLGLPDKSDQRMDIAYMKILNYIDISENPIVTNFLNEDSINHVAVILASPDAYAETREELDNREFKPVLPWLVGKVLVGPLTMEYWNGMKPREDSPKRSR